MVLNLEEVGAAPEEGEDLERAGLVILVHQDGQYHLAPNVTVEEVRAFLAGPEPQPDGDIEGDDGRDTRHYPSLESESV